MEAERVEEKMVITSFDFSHASDWSRLTKNKPFEFRSFRSYSLSENENVEVLISRCHNKTADVGKFLRKMVSIGKIYEIISSLDFSPRVGLHVISGPYARTVRELVRRYDAASYNSFIANGYQKWELVIPEKNCDNLLSELKELGNLENVTRSEFVKKERISFLGQNTIDVSHLSLILSEKEIAVMKAALEMGFFEDVRKVSITEIAMRLNKNKSTIDREIRSAVNKILKLVTFRLDSNQDAKRYFKALSDIEPAPK